MCVFELLNLFYFFTFLYMKVIGTLGRPPAQTGRWAWESRKIRVVACAWSSRVDSGFGYYMLNKLDLTCVYKRLFGPHSIGTVLLILRPTVFLLPLLRRTTTTITTAKYTNHTIMTRFPVAGVPFPLLPGQLWRQSVKATYINVTKT